MKRVMVHLGDVDKNKRDKVEKSVSNLLVTYPDKLFIFEVEEFQRR